MSANGACWRCRWYEHDRDAENGEVGWCHRYPPQMVVSDGEYPTTGRFPPVSFLGYCGEFEGRDCMTATDELRRLLDERGVEWRRTPHYSSESIDNETVFRGEGIEWIANDHLNGHIGLRALRYEVTPEQAVEATLGRGTCEVVSKLLIEGEYVPAEYYEFEMECGEGFKWDESEPPRYCPNCGRKVVDA